MFGITISTATDASIPLPFAVNWYFVSMDTNDINMYYLDKLMIIG